MARRGRRKAESTPAACKTLSGSKVYADFTKPGKQALKAEHRGLVIERAPARVACSLALDGALTATKKAGKKWDYVLVPTSSTTHTTPFGMEVHPVREGEVKDIIAKKKAAEAALAGVFVVKPWYWIASGTIPFASYDPRGKQLNDAGILVTRVIELR
jgi:hypothetical protein